MRRSSGIVAACVASLLFASSPLAQPRSDHGPGRSQHYDQGRGRDAARPSQDRYYYNGRWVDDQEWQRHNDERERWARDYQQRRGARDNDKSTAIIAGILGFALGAAIVGSSKQAEHARTADEKWDDYCAKKYRSYDRRSRTYMGNDGLRRYCQ